MILISVTSVQGQHHHHPCKAEAQDHRINKKQIEQEQKTEEQKKRAIARKETNPVASLLFAIQLLTSWRNLIGSRRRGSNRRGFPLSHI